MANKTKPVLPKGTRDFGLLQTARRKWMLNNITRVFEKYGYQELITPALENLSVLQGKYGDEGDQLLFKVLKNGDFMKKVSDGDLEKGSIAVLSKISEKGLRYDLTVPFARYVSANWSDLPKPFKRYAVQPVYRADRPQKGRYQEFYQCDVDVAGTPSLLCESEMIGIFVEGLKAIGLQYFTIKLNHRGLLTAIAKLVGQDMQENLFFTLIDKLDKNPFDKIQDQFLDAGVKDLGLLEKLVSSKINLKDLETALPEELTNSEFGKQAYLELQEVVKCCTLLNIDLTRVELDLSLARGLSYYTGCIFEVKAENVQIGSICGGGRYANLTENFGLDGYSGVGISFGIDRVYDVLEELNLWPEDLNADKILLVGMDDQGFAFNLEVLAQLRDNDIAAECYPSVEKLKKPMSYANKAGIKYIIITGSREVEGSRINLKNLESGEQFDLSLEALIAKFQQT
jgi:histidyl-tRNA synthetase